MVAYLFQDDELISQSPRPGYKMELTFFLYEKNQTVNFGELDE